MAGQEQAQRPGGRDEDDEASAGGQVSAQHSTDEVDSILDEIDDVLEENAEEFVKQFVQKGGQ